MTGARRLFAIDGRTLVDCRRSGHLAVDVKALAKVLDFVVGAG